MPTYERFARNQRVVIRTNDSKHPPNTAPNKFTSQDKNAPPLDRLPSGRGQMARPSLTRSDSKQNLEAIPEHGKIPDRHFTEEERRKKNKLVTYWRTRGAHDLILEQKRNLELGKQKLEKEKEFLKARREKALKERMIEKKVEEAEAKGETYIPEDDLSATDSKSEAQSGKVKGQKTGAGQRRRTKKLVVLGPKGERISENVAFLCEQVDENRAGLWYKERKVKPGPEYEKHYGMDYAKKQKNHNMYNPLFCLCNPVYHWTRTDLLGDLKREAEDVTQWLKYITSRDGEPLYIMGNYRVGQYKHHSLWFPINTGFYLWFNILDNPKTKFMLPDKLSWLEFELTEVQGKQLQINCYLIDSTNNEALRKSRFDQMPDLDKDIVEGEGHFKSRLFSEAESVVYCDVTKAFEHPQSQTMCLLWVNCSGKAWLGNAWAVTKRPRIIFRDKPSKKSTKKKLNF